MASTLFTLLLLACCASVATGESLIYSYEGYTLNFYDDLGNFNQTLQDRMVDTFFTVYPQLVETFNADAPKEVTFIVDPEYDGVAATWAPATVRFDPGYLEERIYDDVDSVTHECMHVVAAVSDASVPDWATEGMADYARDLFGVNNAAAGWALPDYSSDQHYTDGYGVTASFFKWIESEYHADFAVEFDASQRDGTWADYFRNTFGMSVQEMWDRYALYNEIN
ncbi:hypothetical protein AAVH_38205 [Aphelenchoides avenae]|nr:hypothetical protein AAVH_38205 [Aphelenchus avenae]